jgi:hypothetical protein
MQYINEHNTVMIPNNLILKLSRGLADILLLHRGKVLPYPLEEIYLNAMLILFMLEIGCMKWQSMIQTQHVLILAMSSPMQNCCLIWASKLQTEIALSTTEVEYIALSTAAREIISILELAKAVKHKVVASIKTPVIRCKIFEDNQGAVEMANVPKM